ncbi:MULTISPECIES: cell division topological specificity factor MinE [Allohahella]|jgi:cell division topological specificity factor|uniref:Cell division topological specificity factor n=1 Tax=Allohahella marinimesophila TaxID=1054972 RepID=A0ABP7Q429_9GAMM|nr:cell division topological specificity factor MinE [Hahellaceae bacterium]|tara:strand:+ start:23220 stop:23468 length:249 start_codon:yes stop_codon:yes gene_type:complete
MSFFDYFRTKKTATANMAKERLQIIVAHERNRRGRPDYLDKLEQELLEVIGKYVKINREDVQVQLDQNDDCAVLELNITLPD